MKKVIGNLKLLKLFCPLGKKGVTPLMATVLLVSFAIALGVVIMSFGRAQIESEAQCPIDINLKFAVISNTEQFCYDAAKQELRFTIENGVNIKVEGLIVSVIGTDNAETYDLSEAKIIKAGTYLGKVSYDSKKDGEIRQVKFSPKVIFYEDELICSEKALISESVRMC